MTSQQPAPKGKVLQPAKRYALDDNQRIHRSFIAVQSNKGLFSFIPDARENTGRENNESGKLYSFHDEG